MPGVFDAVMHGVLARTYKMLIWEGVVAVQRLRAQLLGYFATAVTAFEDLDAPDSLELLRKAADPARAAKLTYGGSGTGHA